MPRRGKATNSSHPKTGNAFNPLPLPSGVSVPMCWCGDPCKVAKSDEEETYMQRYWMCANFEFEPTPEIRRINLMTPPPLCDFEQWIDTEIKPQNKERLEYMRQWDAERKEKIEQRRKEEAAEKEHKAEAERRRVAAYREERERKLERARRAKAAMEENPDAQRKGKWPRCTQ
ncbi:hypothetical protein DAI22_02g202000 [Oryza sativa Japonica Group]|nr:hypothetical protein DAI22_11g238400 [Oryza sativa Japonica Group]KAF2945219.1 hypothetical protein DAI22_02g202000 [Oryza sativa Japonica Group]